MLSELKGTQKTGMDFSGHMISIAKKRYPHLKFYQMNAEEITLNEKFDVIIISHTIAYLSDIQKAFREIKKVCHPRTKIIINEYNYLWEPLLKLSEMLGFKTKDPETNWLSPQDITNLLYLEDFEVYHKTRRMIIPFYIPIISAFTNKYIARLPLFKHLCLNQYLFARPVETEVINNDSYSVSVIIPARNESGSIMEAVKRMPQMGKWTELIFIEGGSIDDTWDKIQEVYSTNKDSIKIKIARQDGKGKGDAVRKGFDMAEGDILMILDADLTIPPEELPKFYKALTGHKGEFINGSRLVYPLEKNSMQFLNVLGNKFFSKVFTWLLEQPFKDTLCGVKVLFRSDYRHIKDGRKFFGDLDAFGDFDLILGAFKLNLKITEIPVKYGERKYGSTNISRFRHGFLLLRMCLRAARKIKFI